jgi:hypothetical protein
MLKCARASKRYAARVLLGETLAIKNAEAQIAAATEW